MSGVSKITAEGIGVLLLTTPLAGVLLYTAPSRTVQFVLGFMYAVSALSLAIYEWVVT